MRNLTVILLLGVMLSQSLSRFFIVMEYQANKNYIAEFLCVNRAKPQLKCNGKCYLSQKLKKAEEDKRGLQEKSDLLLFYMPFRESALADFPSGHPSPPFFAAPYRYLYSQGAFHPPQPAV